MEKIDQVQRYNVIIAVTLAQAERGEFINPRNIIMNIRSELDQIVNLTLVTEREIAHLRLKLDTFLSTI